MNRMESVLSEYQQYLNRRRLAKVKHIPYFVKWVRRFLVFAKNHAGKSFDEVYELFGDFLGKNSQISDWQIRQALDAVQIYGYQFRGISSSSQDERKTCSCSLEHESVVQRLRVIVRLRHYSYRTEKAYVYWTTRFLTYCSRTGIGNAITEKDVKSFLTHLALEQNVSASTQNQAFSALLLLCREILHVDLTEMKKNVRAKRGRRLPVVLSVNEVKRLFAEIDDSRRLMIELLYGSGLRLSELLRLRVKDIDFENDFVLVRSGKGDQDRTTMIYTHVVRGLRAPSTSPLDALRQTPID